MCCTWLAFALSAAAAPPEPAVALLSARSGILPWTMFDHATGICGWQRYTRVEAIATATGETAWSAPGWTRAIGELADGAVVVTNIGFGGSGALKIGVLDRATGRERFSCEAPQPASALAAEWTPTADGLYGYLWTVQAPSGIRRPSPPPVPPLRVTLGADACVAEETERSDLAQPALRDAPGPWSDGALAVHLEQSPVQPMEVRTSLVGRRGEREVWRRELAPPPAPCRLP